MSKTIRVYLVVAVAAVVGLFVGVKVLDMPIVGIAIAVLALAGGLVFLRRESADEGDFFAAPDEPAAAEPTTPTASTSTATFEPLATWEPEGLEPWSPPEADAGTTVVEEEEEELDLLDLEELEHIDEFVEAEAEAASLEDSLDVEVEVEAVEVEAEPEPVEVEAEPEPVEVHAAVIDEIEDVHSDDDIMKASHATELSVTAPEAADNSELAKLLAKVQSRLAAYE